MNANSISLHRIFNLFRFEFLMHRKLYLMGIPGVFLITTVIFLMTVYFTNLDNYSVLYYGQLLFLVIFGVGFSFIDLRDKRSSQVYLTLPCLASEKYFVQFFTRVLLFPVIFTLMFIIGVSVSKDILHMSSITTFYVDNGTPIVKDNLDINQMIFVFNSWNKPAMTYFSVFGLGFLIISLMFSGGIIFGKWNFISMPLVVAFILLMFFGSYYGLSWFVDASEFGLGGNYSIRIDHPEIVEGVPLFILNCFILIWIAVFFSFVVAYFKLKEREV
ncbi:hypothetical protein U3A58_11085 [Algoriphagus sp. C2-6-M1]|uniref:hypothetical protein n=1 Tax=Algoriphagus persicinus TaxID=3108754 RepID=UPI002B37D103|nr:hypothetical protein [Algoriphagus sp. C2-6-M1]MEB2780938.1 hypothetical protein [Algoriphagus sp. C2-6-M1]